MSDEAIVEALKGARLAIATYGWCRFDYGSPERGFCVSGAIRVGSMGGSSLPFSRALTESEVSAVIGARRIVSRVLVERGVEPGRRSPTSWNDTVAANKEEVLEVLDLAIIKATEAVD